MKVTNGAAATGEFPVTVADRAPGLLAPASFVSGSTRYVAALLSDGTYVGPPDLVAGLPFRRARPGETILLYGIGFGSTTPQIPAGQVVGQSNTVDNVVVHLNNTPARVDFAGLAAGAVGLYQFNVVIPAGTAMFAST